MQIACDHWRASETLLDPHSARSPDNRAADKCGGNRPNLKDCKSNGAEHNRFRQLRYSFHRAGRTCDSHWESYSGNGNKEIVRNEFECSKRNQPKHFRSSLSESERLRIPAVTRRPKQRETLRNTSKQVVGSQVPTRWAPLRDCQLVGSRN